MAIESTSKVDDEQWLAYWILYSFLTLVEMLFQPALEWYVCLSYFPNSHTPMPILPSNNLFFVMRSVICRNCILS